MATYSDDSELDLGYGELRAAQKKHFLSTIATRAAGFVLLVILMIGGLYWTRPMRDTLTTIDEARREALGGQDPGSASIDLDDLREATVDAYSQAAGLRKAVEAGGFDSLPKLVASAEEGKSSVAAVEALESALEEERMLREKAEKLAREKQDALSALRSANRPKGWDPEVTLVIERIARENGHPETALVPYADGSYRASRQNAAVIADVMLRLQASDYLSRLEASLSELREELATREVALQERDNQILSLEKAFEAREELARDLVTQIRAEIEALEVARQDCEQEDRREERLRLLERIALVIGGFLVGEIE